MKLSLFKPKALAKKEPCIISVPDIKEYLVKEYERVNALREENERLLAEIDKSKELQMKYDAAMVTLDEFSKRNELLYSKHEKKKNDLVEMQNKISQVNSELNSYKIKFNEAAITREEIETEIIDNFKIELLEKIKNHRGNLSKGIVFSIIKGETILPMEE